MSFESRQISMPTYQLLKAFSISVYHISTLYQPITLNLSSHYRLIRVFIPKLNKNAIKLYGYNIGCVMRENASSGHVDIEGPDQPAHARSLIRAFDVRI